MYRKFLLYPLIYLLFATFASCVGKKVEISGAAWGTSYHITYVGDRNLGDSIVAVMRDVESELSMFDSCSTVSRINRGEDLRVGEMFTEVFTLSKEISRRSGGAFDPTVGPLVNLWGFGYDKASSCQDPSDWQIDSALSTVGMEACRIEGGKVLKKHARTVFDFSSIAKGYGVDAVAAMLRRNGCNDLLVEIGGEIVARGFNVSGRRWRVQIDAPSYDVNDLAGHSRMCVIELCDAAVATSGNYRNFRDTAGGRIGHTLDPRTGRPVNTSTVSATVVASSCAVADALATACMVLSPDEAMKLIDGIDGADVMIVTDDDGSLSMIRSKGFPKILELTNFNKSIR